MKQEVVEVTCENGHIIRHRGSYKKGGRKLEVPKTCVRCCGDIVNVKKVM